MFLFNRKTFKYFKNSQTQFTQQTKSAKNSKSLECLNCQSPVLFCYFKICFCVSKIKNLILAFIGVSFQFKIRWCYIICISFQFCRMSRSALKIVEFFESIVTNLYFSQLEDDSLCTQGHVNFRSRNYLRTLRARLNQKYFCNKNVKNKRETKKLEFAKIFFLSFLGALATC